MAPMTDAVRSADPEATASNGAPSSRIWTAGSFVFVRGKINPIDQGAGARLSYYIEHTVLSSTLVVAGLLKPRPAWWTCGPMTTSAPQETPTPETIRRRSGTLGGRIAEGGNGTSGGTRTPDRRFWRPLLYQLSYTRARLQYRQARKSLSMPQGAGSGRTRANDRLEIRPDPINDQEHPPHRRARNAGLAGVMPGARRRREKRGAAAIPRRSPYRGGRPG